MGIKVWFVRRGVSPVVGLVLLIAISLIAATGVWFWMGSYTSKPEVINVPYAKPALSIASFNGYSAVVKNVGGTVADSAAFVYNSSGVLVGYLALNESPLQPGESGVISFVSNVDDLYAGEYTIVSSIYPMITFNLLNDYLKPVRVLFFGGTDGYVYAVYAKNGSQYWNHSIGVSTVSSPSINNGLLFIGSGVTTGTLYALNTTNGSEVWGFSTSYPIRSSPLYHEGVVYFSSNDGYFHAVYASNGSEKWNFSIGAEGIEHRSSPTYYDDVILVGTGDQGTDNTGGKVYWIYASNGSQKCYYDTIGQTDYSSPLVKDSVVYIGSGNDYNNTFALYADNCSKKWNRSLNSFFVSSPIASNGLLIISTDSLGNMVYALNITTGEVVWSHAVGDDVSSSAFVYEGMVFVGSDDDYLHVLNLSTGDELWNYSTGDDVDCSPVVYNDVVYFGSSDGYFYAVNVTTHQQLWNFSAATAGADFDSSPALCNIRNWNCIYPTISGMSN